MIVWGGPFPINIKRFKRMFKDYPVRFECFSDHLVVRYACSDDPLDAIELSYLLSLIDKEAVAISGRDNNEIIITQCDIHQNRIDLSFKDSRVEHEVIQQVLKLSVYE